MPAIDRFLTNRDPSIRLFAATATAHIRVGGPAAEAMPTLLAGLDNKLGGVPNVSLRVNLREESGLGLSGCATRGPEAAAMLCGELGPAATYTLPDLERRLEDKSPWLRIAAAQAIWRISHDATRSLPTLVAVLDAVSPPNSPGNLPHDQALVLVRVIEAITEKEPAAKAAAPSVKRVRTFSMAVRDAANRALCAFNPAR